MFILYKSIEFDLLIKKAYDIILNKPLSNPLNQEIFIVSNKDTKQWIKVFIANTYKITCNIKFLKLKNFIFKIFNSIIPNNNSQLEFSQSSITWKIINNPDIINLIQQIILKTNDQNNIFYIASLISNLFQAYLIYRPDKINAWTKNKTEKKNLKKYWQQIIWQKIIKYTKTKKKTWHFSNLLFTTIKKIQKKFFNRNFLPTRIFIFETKPINLAYMLLLKSISKHCFVYFFYVTPKYEEKKIFFNTELNYKKIQQEIKKHTLLSFFYSKKNNTLFNKIISDINEKNFTSQSFWNIYEYEKILLLKFIKDKSINLISKQKSPCLLNMLKKKILKHNCCFKIKNQKQHKKVLISNKDNSFSIHACYNIIKEIEILHDNLLNILNKNRNILFQDILVISKNLDKYVPYINYIFTSVIPKNYIPFCITHNTPKNSILFNIFLQLINLPNIPIDINHVTDFLNILHYLKKTKLHDKEISILLEIINKTKLKWENDNILSNYSFSEYTIKYWEHGIKRIFLGKVINNQDYESWNKIIAFDEINTSYYEIFNKLISLIFFLDKWKKILSKPKFLSKWKITFKYFFNDFFTQEQQENSELKFIIKKLKKIINGGIKEKYPKKISINLFKNEITHMYTYTANVNNLFSGKITFSHNFSLINIPFKVIYILGMDDSFTSEKYNSLEIYNLINIHPRICDPSYEKKYLHLFLKTLLSSKKFFYISYNQNSQDKNKSNDPSFIIKVLLEYITKKFFIIKKHNQEKSFENIKSHIYHIHTQDSYNKKILLKKTHYPTLNNIRLTFITDIPNVNKKFIYNLSSIKNTTINKNTLISFWKNPIQTFFNKRLNVKLNHIYKQTELQYHSPYIKSHQYEINKNILNFLINKKKTSKLFKYYQNIGIIPNNNIGEIFWEKKIQLITPLFKKILRIKKTLKTIDFNIIINKKYKLIGTLKNINSTEGLLYWTANTTRFEDIISVWLKHLIYCSLYENKNTLLIGLDNKIIKFSKLKKTQSEKYLQKYIYGYFQGMKKPIYLTNSGINWIKKNYTHINKKKNTNKQNILINNKIICETWNGNNWFQGEKKNLYVRKIITELNQKNIFNICKTAKKWIIPILKNISYSKYN